MTPPRKMSFCQIFNPHPSHRDRQAPLEVFAHFKVIASSVPLRQSVPPTLLLRHSVPPTLLLRHSVSPNSPDNGEVLHFCYGFNHFVTVFPQNLFLFFWHHHCIVFIITILSLFLHGCIFISSLVGIWSQLRWRLLNNHFLWRRLTGSLWAANIVNFWGSLNNCFL